MGFASSKSTEKSPAGRKKQAASRTPAAAAASKTRNLSRGAAAAGDLPAHEVPFRLHGHLIVVEECAIGGLEGLNCVLDTGASATVIHPDIARKLKLNGTAREVATYGRKERIMDVVLPTIRWGELEFERLSSTGLYPERPAAPENGKSRAFSLHSGYNPFRYTSQHLLMNLGSA